MPEETSGGLPLMAVEDGRRSCCHLWGRFVAMEMSTESREHHNIPEVVWLARESDLFSVSRPGISTHKRRFGLKVRQLNRGTAAQWLHVEMHCIAIEHITDIRKVTAVWRPAQFNAFYKYS